MSRLALLLVPILVLTAACGGGDVAVVEGVSIEASQLNAMHPDSPQVDDEKRAASLFLIILHQLIVDHAGEEFGVVVTEEEVDAAFQARTTGLGGDVAAALAQRGETPARVRLEAELDVLRERLEEEIVRAGDSDVDLDKAYRDFLSVNSRVCLVVLTLADADLADEVERRAEAGEDLDEIFADYPDRTARIDMGCLSPLDHGLELAPVALDGELGRSYAFRPEAGGVYLAKVTERDAPAREDVADEILRFAIDRQGPGLFDRWAADLLRSASVEVSGSVGRWEPVPDSGDIPTVVPG